MRIDPELKGIRDSEELAYFSRNTVQISEETYPDEYESYFKFLQLLLIQKPDDFWFFESPSAFPMCTGWLQKEFNLTDLQRGHSIKDLVGI